MWLFNWYLEHFGEIPPSVETVEKKHHYMHNVGHWPFMKASLLGTQTSRHLLCSSLHRTSDPKTGIYVTGSEHTWSMRKIPTQRCKGRELLTSIQKVVDALVLPQGREVEIIHQCIQAILRGQEKGQHRGKYSWTATFGTKIAFIIIWCI